MLLSVDNEVHRVKIESDWLAGLDHLQVMIKTRICRYIHAGIIQCCTQKHHERSSHLLHGVLLEPSKYMQLS